MPQLLAKDLENLAGGDVFRQPGVLSSTGLILEPYALRVESACALVGRSLETDRHVTVGND